MVEGELTLPGVQKIRRGPLRDQVREQIKELILTNSLRPGQALVIDQLAAHLDVSHTPVREALAMLQHDGLVVMRPYGNPKVAPVRALDVRDAWEMRLLLEGWAIRQAVIHLPDESLDELEHMLDVASNDALESRYDTHLQSDTTLHEMILASAQNTLFKRLSDLVNDRSLRIRSLVESIAPSEQVLEIIDEHRGIVEALRLRDTDLAVQRLDVHLQAGMQRTLAALERISSDEE
jgi:DNA-binding GntR family transcriptional regulator